MKQVAESHDSKTLGPRLQALAREMRDFLLGPGA